MIDCSKVRFRTEAFSGTGERDAATVMAYETFELGNTDILETLADGVLRGSRIESKMRGFVEGLIDNGFVDDLPFDDGVEFYKEVLSCIKEKTGVDVKYALWLADRDVVTDSKWYGKYMDGKDDFESYVIGPVILSELGFDGTLYGYEKVPQSLERRLEDLQDDLTNIIDEREGVRDNSKRAIWLDDQYMIVCGEIAEIETALNDALRWGLEESVDALLNGAGERSDLVCRGSEIEVEKMMD